jgi:hypothetical protein
VWEISKHTKYTEKHMQCTSCVTSIQTTKLKILYFVYSDWSFGWMHKFSENSLQWKLRYSQMRHCYVSEVSLVTVRTYPVYTACRQCVRGRSSGLFRNVHFLKTENRTERYIAVQCCLLLTECKRVKKTWVFIHICPTDKIHKTSHIPLTVIWA